MNKTERILYASNVTHSSHIHQLLKNFKAKKVESGFHYTSANNDKWETVNSLKRLIELHVINT